MAEKITAHHLLSLSNEEAKNIIEQMGVADLRAAMEWPFWRREDQVAPSDDWRVWMVLAGRGYGKTRMGAEWVSTIARANPDARIALIAASMAEARGVMVEGESGILSLYRGREIEWQPSLKRLTWPGGAQASLYSAAEAESLRGPQHSHAWADEIAKWGDGLNVWSNLRLGIRLGNKPQIIATTTPRPVPLVKQLLAEDGVAITRGRTKDNIANLAPDFVADMQALYSGTRLGRQELDGEYIEELEGALWTRALIEKCRAAQLPCPSGPCICGF